MLNKSEKNLLLLIRIIPILIIIFFSIFTTTFSLIQNNQAFEKEVIKLKEDYTNSSKARVKEEVERVYNTIITEKRTTEARLKENIKSRVNEAYTIASSIYKENIDKSKDEISRLIKAALRDIRFNDNRGYFFVYKMDGTNIILPKSMKLEGKNLLNLPDAKGNFVIQEFIDIAKNQKEGFHSWWWYKPQDNTKQYKKIGFVKYFEELDWFIGTGEYVEDFEIEIQKHLLYIIQNLKYGKNGYVFVIDNKGIYLTHANIKNVGVNRIDLKDPNGFMITREIMKIAQEGEGYTRYIGTIKPSTGKPAEKITYVKGYKDWEWAIASGAYISDVDEIIAIKKAELEEKNNFEINKMIISSIIVTLIFIVLSFILTRIIQRYFIEYQEKVRNETETNRQKDEIMFQQSKMAAMGEMLENIAHQWRQPLSAISMQASGLQLNITFDKNIDKDTINEKLNNIIKSTQFLSQTIDDFRDFFKVDKEKEIFELKTALERTLKIVESKFKNRNIEVELDVTSVDVVGFENEFIQALMNILNNAKDVLENMDKDELRVIKISIHKQNNQALIKIQDNGGGIPEDILTKVFEPYFTTKHQSQGTGIGLYMTQQIIVSHLGGSIDVENMPIEYKGKNYLGAEFTITIPCN